jgi:hypothetical protein
LKEADVRVKDKLLGLRIANIIFALFIFAFAVIILLLGLSGPSDQSVTNQLVLIPGLLDIFFALYSIGAMYYLKNLPKLNLGMAITWCVIFFVQIIVSVVFTILLLATEVECFFIIYCYIVFMRVGIIGIIPTIV